MRAYPIPRRVVTLGLLAALIASLALVSGSAESAGPKKRPQPFPQAGTDGCQRSPGGLITGDSPAWVYVNKDRRPKFVKGTAFTSHIFGNDLSTNHLGYDWNVNIKPDKPYVNFVGGDPMKGKGNFAPTDDPGERVGALHTEWEHQVFQSFAWPSERDRVQAWGGWIWDCAHWNANFSDNGAADPGEKTEFHSLRGIVVQRKNRYGGKHGETQADAFISSDGTRAHASAECALSHHPINGDKYDAGFKTCMQSPANAWQPVNDMDYKFFVPAPKKPSSNAQLTFTVLTRLAGGPPETIQKTSNGINVTVKFKGFGASHARLRYGKTFLVGWRNAKPKGRHLRVKLGTLTVMHSLDPNPTAPNHQTSTAPGEYVMFLEINGGWLRLNQLLPNLSSVSDGQTFTLGKTVTFYIPGNAKLRVYGEGWECDVGGELIPCPKGRHEVALFNDPIGDKIDQLSASSAPGSHTLMSPSGDWKLTYEVTKLKN
jgi:hypothetical protein